MRDNAPMNLTHHTQEGLRNLYFSKLRSILALLGVLVGTASVVAMVLGGQLATNEALKQFKSLGTDLLAISLNTTSDDGRTIGQTEELSLEQAMGLQSANPAITRVAPYTQLYQPVSYEGHPINAVTLGVTDGFADILHVQLKQGRFISLADKYAFFCVIGEDVYHSMKEITGKEPLGQTLQIGKNLFVVIGVAENWPENSFLYANINSSILIPLLASTVTSKYAAINNIILRLIPEASIPEVQSAISINLETILSGKQLSFRSAQELIAKMRKQSDILTIFLGLIGSISLIVGGIGVMNIMLVSVIERRREIGIRKAVGATSSDIAALFLMEAVILSLIGGSLGVIIGMLIAYMIAVFSHWEFTFFILPPLVGFSVSVAVGIFFGFYPAYKASQLNPIDALRAE